MKPNKIIFFLIVILAISACQKDLVEPAEMPKGLNAVWVENGYDEDVSIFKKSNEFDSNKYGFHIIDSGKFIERKNAGFCGTPPITYETYEGTWSKISDSLLLIESPYWGGTMIFKMKIVSMNENELKVRYKYEND